MNWEVALSILSLLHLLTIASCLESVVEQVLITATVYFTYSVVGLYLPSRYQALGA